MVNPVKTCQSCFCRVLLSEDIYPSGIYGMPVTVSVEITNHCNPGVPMLRFRPDDKGQGVYGHSPLKDIQPNLIS